MLLPSPPTPADAGARIRNAGLLALLSADHQVDVLVPTPPRRPRSVVRRFADMARSDLPDMAQRLWSPEFAATVRRQLQQCAYDAVQAEGIEMARLLRLEMVPPSSRVYDAHNAEFLLQRRLAHTASPAGRLYSRLQWRRLERFEGDLVRNCRMTLAVSEHDANQLIALAGVPVNVRAIPNAIDVAAYPFQLPPESSRPNLLFVGKLDFRPNAVALGWFIREVLPRLGDTCLFAVGDAPPAWLVAAGQHDSRIAVTGYVADERPYFARCSALVLPVQTGGGSRLKALVAMASGLPIVSTRLGMEGLEVEPEVHYLQADSAEEWTASLRRLLQDVPLRQRLACQARALVEERYTWSAMRDRVRAAYAWLSPQAGR
jgi:glycosyltransferase involved in cell wall biosynthesis